MTSRILAVHHQGAPLRLWDDAGAHPITAVDGFEDLRRPALSKQGWAAVQSITRGAGTEWQGATLLLGPDQQLVDAMPWAMSTTAAAWAPDGRQLARVVTDYAGDAAVEVVDVHTGHTRSIGEGHGLSAVTWLDTEHLIVARGAALECVSLGDRERQRLRSWPSADRFLRFGSDDYYPTIRHITADADRIVVEVSWHRQGRPAAHTVYDWSAAQPTCIPSLDGCIQPIQIGRQLIASCTDRGLVLLKEARPTTLHPLDSLIAAVIA